MDVGARLQILSAMYAMYDELIKNMNFACERFCNSCCTCNLTATTLEAYKIICYLNKENSLILDEINLTENPTRFIPNITVNKMAKTCSYNQDFYEESAEHGVGSCLALLEGQCRVYEVRPFGCRCMLSTGNCNKTGFASIDPYLLTINSVFIQCIEHIDVLGYTCNFYDVLLAMASRDNRCIYESELCIDHIDNLVGNQPIRSLMIPPEHAERIQPVLSAIRNIKVRI